MIASQRVIRKIIGIGMRGAGALCHGAPGRPGEEGCQVVQFLRVADGADGKAAIIDRMLEIRLPDFNLIVESVHRCREKGQRIGFDVVAIGFKQRANFAFYGSAFARTKVRIRFGEPALRCTLRKIGSPIMQHRRSEIGTQIGTMTPDSAIIHQTVLEEDLLTVPDVISGIDKGTICIDHAGGNGRSVLVRLEGQQDQDRKAHHKRESNGATPPR